MSWSLQLHNGDFTLTSARLGTVTDENKLTQDLRCALLERMGTDEMHLDFGSLIDGGRLPDGTVVPSVVGMSVAQAASTIQSEVQRVARGYQSQQLNRAKDDRTTYNRVTLSSAEVLLGVSGMHITQHGDVLQVLLTLQTARGEDINIALPILT